MPPLEHSLVLFSYQPAMASGYFRCTITHYTSIILMLHWDPVSFSLVLKSAVVRVYCWRWCTAAVWCHCDMAVVLSELGLWLSLQATRGGQAISVACFIRRDDEARPALAFSSCLFLLILLLLFLILSALISPCFALAGNIVARIEIFLPLPP